MSNRTLADVYRGYIDCLNAQDWKRLGHYVGDDVAYNGETIGFEAYRQAREDEFREIPDLHFTIGILVVEENLLASRLIFNISPSGEFLGLPVNGRKISFCENVFYEFENDRISKVLSIVDKAVIERQLAEG